MRSDFAGATNVNAIRRKRVYFEGTDTLYEGLILCYDQDGTDAPPGFDAATYAEGSQNPGKWVRTEKPAAANMKFKAGIVLSGEWVGKDGPRWVDVAVLNGAIVPVRGTESFSIGDKLYAAAADYEATNVPQSDGFIGYAMETIDRSTTEGLVLVRTERSAGGTNRGTLAAGATSLSPLLWQDVDLDRLRNDPAYGFIFEDDFLGQIDITTTDGWVVTAVTTGAIAPVADEAGGAILFDSAGSTTADDGVQAQLTNCMVKPAAGVTIVFEARVKMNDATDQYFIGLAGVDTTLIASGVLDDVVSKCGFFHEAASTNDKISSVTARTSADDKTADVGDNADGTYTTLGFKINGLTSVEFYVNGVLVETGSTAANIANDVMCLSGVSQIEGTGADAEMTVDWVKIASIGGRA